MSEKNNKKAASAPKNKPSTTKKPTPPKSNAEKKPNAQIAKTIKPTVVSKQTAPKTSAQPKSHVSKSSTIKTPASKPTSAKPTPLAKSTAIISTEFVFPILEFDGDSKPLVQAEDFTMARKRITRCLITYFQDIADKFENELKINQVFKIRTEGLKPIVYEMKINFFETIYIMVIAGGAPNAAKAMEVMSAMGIKKFMVCAGAGTLDTNVTQDKVLIPTSAIRDEGTSYHYMPPSREISINKGTLSKITSTLTKAGEKYLTVKTWTTDAPYRITANKTKKRQVSGCDIVESECSAFYAVAEHKKLICGELLYAGELVKKDGWDYHIWHAATDLREKLFNLALKCLLSL